MPLSAVDRDLLQRCLAKQPGAWNDFVDRYLSLIYHAVHYTAVERGTPVYASDETQVGEVVEVLDNYREHIFDGIVIRTSAGDQRFVDAPEVARTAERGVTLTIGPGEVDELPPPERTSPAAKAGGLLGRLKRR